MVDCPNLTEVTYAGVSQDKKIALQYTISIYRTDDITRGVYRFRYDVKEKVDFSKLVLFQCGGDDYSYTGERKFAYGDEKGENTWKMIYREAVGNHLEVKATRGGKLEWLYPIRLRSTGRIMEFEVTGGLAMYRSRSLKYPITKVSSWSKKSITNGWCSTSLMMARISGR